MLVVTEPAGKALSEFLNLEDANGHHLVIYLQGYG